MALFLNFKLITIVAYIIQCTSAQEKDASLQGNVKVRPKVTNQNFGHSYLFRISGFELRI